MLGRPEPTIRALPSPPEGFEGVAPLNGSEFRGGELDDVRELLPGSGAFARLGSEGVVAKGSPGARLAGSILGPGDGMSYPGSAIVSLFGFCRDMLKTEGGRKSLRIKARPEGGTEGGRRQCLPSLALRPAARARGTARRRHLACRGIAAGHGAGHGACRRPSADHTVGAVH